MASNVKRIANPSVRDRVSAEEWDTRVNLAAAYRLVALYGWTHLVQNHISARVPGEDEHFLINPSGMLVRELTGFKLATRAGPTRPMKTSTVRSEGVRSP